MPAKKKTPTKRTPRRKPPVNRCESCKEFAAAAVALSKVAVLANRRDLPSSVMSATPAMMYPCDLCDEELSTVIALGVDGSTLKICKACVVKVARLAAVTRAEIGI